MGGVSSGLARAAPAHHQQERWRAQGTNLHARLRSWSNILAATHLGFDIHATNRTPDEFHGAVTRRAIGDLMLRRQRYRLSGEAAAVFREYLTRRMIQPRFANARSVRNALERARLRHASRLAAASAAIGKDDLMRLEPADFLSSRVFTESAG